MIWRKTKAPGSPNNGAEKISARPQPQPDMTSDVRYALKYRDARLNVRDIRGLFGAPSLGNAAFYMGMKAGEGNLPAQRGLLQRAAELDFQLDKLTRTDAAPVLGHLAAQDDPLVNGQKLNPMRAVGVESWRDGFATALAPVLNQVPEAELYVIANASYVGIDRIAELSLRHGRPLGILNPKRFGEADGVVGFTLTPNGDDVAVDYLASDFTRPDQAVLFDDVMYTGAVRSQVFEFWGDSTPNFVAARTYQGPPGTTDGHPH